MGDWGWEIAEAPTMWEVEQGIIDLQSAYYDLGEAVEFLTIKHGTNPEYLYPLAYHQITEAESINTLLKEKVLELLEVDIAEQNGVFGKDVIIYTELREQVLNAKEVG